MFVCAEPSISCDFEEPYACGWITVSDTAAEQWSRRQGSVSVNVGPITDYDQGDTTGNQTLIQLLITMTLQEGKDNMRKTCRKPSLPYCV